MSPFYKTFLEFVPLRGRILDAGCGSGRDAKWFSNQGYEVEAFDSSLEMTRMASGLLGKDVQHSSFETFAFDRPFDGVWASASLLHVGDGDLERALVRLRDAICRGGVLYASFKEGVATKEEDGRTFYLQSRETLGSIFVGAGLSIQRVWETKDVRKGRDDCWLNVIARS